MIRGKTDENPMEKEESEDTIQIMATASIIFSAENNANLELPCEELAKKVSEAVLAMEGCPYDVEVNLVLTDDEGICEINRSFRGIDAPTDVLSFPAVDFEEPACFQELEDSDAEFDLDTGEFLLGDIMISADKVIRQAEAFGHSIKREFCFLVAHSMLHLLGYDHMIEEEARVMEEKQESCLAALGIGRE